jgi:hypothetical protein
MISNDTEQTIQTNGTGVKLLGQVDFDDENRARIMSVLSDKMYSKKERAILREYSANSADSMIEAGKDYFGFIVTLPTFDDLNVKFRDFGAGLTASEITNVYCNMGTSTKRNSNAYTGNLGMGSKSFSCISDSVTVTSWNSGEKAIYQIIKGDVRTLPQIYELSRCATDEPTGIEVCIPVKSDIMYTIHEEASNMFKYWPTLPTILNMNEEYKSKMDNFRKTSATLFGDGWQVRPKTDYSAVGVALMGNVSYVLDWNKISSALPLNSHTRCLFDLLQSNDVVLTYEMGAIQFVPSREHLEYSDLTIKALTDKINDIFVKIKSSIQDKFTSATNIWEAKKIYNSIFGSGLPIETEDGNVDINNIKILNGNLKQLEQSLKGQLLYDGKVIEDASFRHINKFDNNDSPATVNGNSHQPYQPVMTTYRPKSGKLKTNKCKVEGNNGITASDYVAVVLNDTNKKSGVAMVARYLLFCDSVNKNYKTVHILNFTTPEMKDLFYKEYNFDSVPVIRMSDIINEVKNWYNLNKTTHSTNNSGRTIRHIEYLDLVSETIEESDVSFKDIEDNVYFLYQATGRRTIGKVSIGSYDYSCNKYKNDVLQAIKTLNDKLDLDIDKVYIVGTTTKNSVWFDKARTNKEWINVMDYIKEQVKSIDVQELVNDTIKNEIVDVEVAKQLMAELEEDHIITNLCETALSITQVEESKNMKDALSELGIWSVLSDTVVPSIDLNKMKMEIEHLYPYINWSNLRYNSYFREDDKKKFIKYVRSMDLYVELNPEIKEEEELVVA